MSLFKQVSILLSLIFLILFVVIATISFNVIKGSAEKSLYENMQSNISNINLVITNVNIDENTIKTVLNNSFENGNYEKIIFRDIKEKIVYDRVKKEETNEEKIPSWFLNFVNIKEIFSVTTISKGWNILGTLELYSSRDVFYTQLYTVFINLIVTLVATFIFFILVLFFLLKTILKPLSVIKKQSDAIMKNEFIFQENMPFTLEFKSLTLSMNIMLKKIQSIFNNANDILKRNKELLYVDELTGLNNRKYLVLKTSEYLDENSVNGEGFLISIILTRVDLLNKLLGYKKADELFIQMSELIKKFTYRKESNIIARTKASEFIIVLPRILEKEVIDICEKLSSSLKSLLSDIDDKEINLYVGLCSFENEKTHGDLLSKIDYTLCQSMINENKDYYYLQKSIYKTRDDWRNIINNAIKDDSFNLLYRDTISLDSKKVVHKSISFEIRTQNDTFSYGEFIAPAIELNLLERVYLKIIEKVLSLDEKSNEVSIQIPSKFIEKLPFKKLSNFLKYKNSFKKIVFELEEESFVEFNYNCLTFIDLIKEYGFEIAIFNFMGISDDYNYLKEQKPKFIKCNLDFLKVNENRDALDMIRKSLGIQIIATSINSEKDLNSLNRNDIDFVAGQITQRI